MNDIDRAKAAFIKADAAGNVDDAKFFLDYIRKMEGAQAQPPAADVKKPSMLSAAVRGLEEGVTLGFSDEIKSFGEKLRTGEDYSDILARRDAETRALAAAYPKTSFAANLGGGIATGGLGAARVLGSQAVRAAAPLARGAISAALGAGEGAVAGAGYANPGDRVEGATSGAVFGGALGAAAPAAGRLVGAAIDKVRSATSIPSAERIASDFIARYAARDAIPAGQLAARVGSAGPNSMPVDVGTNLKSLGEYIAQRTGVGKDIAEKALHARNKGQQSRIISAFKKAADAGDEAVVDAPKSAAISQQFSESLDDLVEISPEDGSMLRLLERPSMRQAWEKARALAKEEGAKLPKLDKLLASVRSGETHRIDTRMLHYVKKGLDDILEPKRDPVTGKLVSDVGKNELKAREQTRSAFRNVIRDKSPRYADALDSSADELRQRSSFFAGRDALGADLRDLKQQVGRLGGKDLEAFRQGYVEAVSEATRKAGGKGFDVSLRAMDEDALRTVFGAKADPLIKELWRERGMRTTSNKITGGSQTFSRMETARDLEGGNAGILGEIAGNPSPAGMLSAVVRRMAQALTGERRPPEKALEAASRLLFSSDPAEIQRMISRSGNAGRPIGLRPSDVPSWAIGLGAQSASPEAIIQKRGR